MTQLDMYNGAQNEASEIRERAERLHQKADSELDDIDRRGDLRVQAERLIREADEIAPEGNGP